MGLLKKFHRAHQLPGTKSEREGLKEIHKQHYDLVKEVEEHYIREPSLEKGLSPPTPKVAKDTSPLHREAAKQKKESVTDVWSKGRGGAPVSILSSPLNASLEQTTTPASIKELKLSKGGSVKRKLYKKGGEQETHTMPDGTEMVGATHGEYEEQMEGLMDKETPMLPDEEMEADYVDFVVNSTLSEDDKNYLESALTEDTKLSELFDQVVESASEFSGSGPINGPGSEVSDSIPARLSDGEFVFTAKATEEIGEDSLMSMMKDAEAVADERQGVAYGGGIEQDKKADIAVSTQGSILAAGGVPPVVPMDPVREEQILSMQSSSPRRGYRTISG